MSPWGVGDMVEKVDTHRVKLWSSGDTEGPVSGCAGQAHDTSPLQEQVLEHFRRFGIHTIKLCRGSSEHL